MLVAIAPTLAANEPPALSGPIQLSLGETRTVLPDSLRPAVTTAANSPVTQLEPVQVARVPSYSVTTPTVLAAGAQPIGSQGGSGAQNRHVRWALTGAAIGLAVGLIDGDDVIERTLIGGGIGFGLSFVLR
jgi:hypothetical protein